MPGVMKIAFIGLGSIATRHIKNTAKVLNNRRIKYEIDVYRHTLKEISDCELKSLVHFTYQEDALRDNGIVYDVIFITNPTSLHYQTIKKCIPFARNMFIEKPVFELCDEDINALGLKDEATYYVACPLRYTAVLQYIKNNIDLSKVFSVRAISSSYLPDWRPNTDYRQTYSAKKELGGGVSIDLIHEWDYLTQFFGIPEQVHYAGGKYSQLEIDSDDLATYIGLYRDKLIELHLDYFGRKTIRECMLYLPNETVVADLTNSQVRYLKENKTIDLKEERNQFQIRELEHFFDIIEGKEKNDSTIQHALDVLKIAVNYKE